MKINSFWIIINCHAHIKSIASLCLGVSHSSIDKAILLSMAMYVILVCAHDMMYSSVNVQACTTSNIIMNIKIISTRIDVIGLTTIILKVQF